MLMPDLIERSPRHACERRPHLATCSQHHDVALQRAQRIKHALRRSAQRFIEFSQSIDRFHERMPGVQFISPAPTRYR